jgi:YbbR domain-containing protein
MTPTLRQSLRGQIYRNALWLLGSLALAIFVWYAAVNQQNPIVQQRYSGRVPVKILKDDTLLVTDAPAPVQVVIRAPRSVWDALDANDIQVTADLRGKPPGSYTVPLSAILAANRIGEVSEVQPTTGTVTLVKRSEAAFDVTLVALRPPPVGFEVGSNTFNENTATVTGSEDAVRRVVSVVARIDLSDQTRTITRSIPVTPIDSDGRTVTDVTVVPAQVDAQINIQPRPGVTVLKVVPNLLTNTLPLGYLVSNYSAEPAVVAVRGDRNIIESLNGTIETDPINLANKVGPFTQTLRLALPTGVTLTDPVNVVVSVDIEAVNITREFATIPVITQGLDPADFNITIQPQVVTVIVKGPQQAVSSLQANEITVFAPLANLGSGTFTVTLQASVAHAGLTSSNISIPNPEARVVIVALRPTATFTPTRPPTVTPTMAPTASATP